MPKAKRPNPGKDFEAVVKLQCGAYEARGLATIRKVDPPSAMRCVGPGQFRPVLLENPFPDFLGAWKQRRGQMIALECKSTAEPRLPCPADNGLKPAQIAALNTWAAAGAMVAVLWEYRTEHAAEMRIVTLEHIDTAKAQGRASIAWADAMPIERGLRHECHTVDFLTAMIQLAEWDE